MAVQIYAMAPEPLPEGCSLFVREQPAGHMFEVRDDADAGLPSFKTWAPELNGGRGGWCCCLWSNCAHLNGGNWTRVERIIPDA